MAGAFLRGSIAFALVLVASLAVQALAPQPAAARPALSFGDHADYDVSIVDLDTGRRWQGDEPRRVGVEVGASSTVAAADGRPVLATPLEFRFAVAGLGGDLGQVARKYWVAADGHVVAVGDQGAGTIAQSAAPVAGAPDPVPTQTTQAVAWRDLNWGAAGTDDLPCGFALPGNDPVRAGDVAATCRVDHGDGAAWPTTIVAPLSDLLGSPGPGRLAHRLDLATAGRSLGTWSSPAAVAALPPAPLLARGALGPEGQGPGSFPLADAFEALLAAPADSAARDLVQRHPDAYIAYARSYEAVDVAGQRQSAWHLVLAGGSDRVERAVVLDPGALPLLPPAVRVGPSSILEYPVDPAPTVFPPAGLAPATLPALDSLRAAFVAATGREPTGWGFSIACRSRGCFEVDARLQMLDERLAAAAPSTARWQRTLEQADRLEVDGSGTLVALDHVEYGQPVPDLLATGAIEPREDFAAPGRVAFPFPSAPAAATVGALGLVAAGLAAAWPLLKVYVPLFSRIEASRMLDHPVRRRVHDLVHEEPGIHARQVATRLGIAGNTAHHHLGRLVGAGYLGERRIAGYHCYFPRGGLDERLQDAVPVLKSRGAQAVLLAVEAQGSPSFRSLMAATGLGYATVHHHAERLWKAGIVSEERDGRARRFRLTELGRRVAEQAHASLDRFPTLPKNAPEMDGTA